MIKFSQNMSCNGIHVQCHIENGKAFLEWRIDCPETEDRVGPARNRHLRLTDEKGNVVLECFQKPEEEEPLRSVLLQPSLWSSTENPYLYRLELFFENGWGHYEDSMSRLFPLRSITMQSTAGDGEKSLFLNGERFELRAVRYEIPGESSLGERQRKILEDMRQFVDLGINCICLEKEEYTESFLQLCDRLGLLLVMMDEDRVWVSGENFQAQQGSQIRSCVEAAPVFRGSGNALLTPQNQPSPAFYRYKARWSKKPFVYIALESLRRLASGNYTVTCYSNCSRVALYSDGNLFEFQKGEEEFTFWEIPSRSPCIALSAEADGCSTSLSVHKTFTKLSPIGDN